jgi:hypothetical protein
MYFKFNRKPYLKFSFIMYIHNHKRILLKSNKFKRKIKMKCLRKNPFGIKSVICEPNVIFIIISKTYFDYGEFYIKCCHVEAFIIQISIVFWPSLFFIIIFVLECFSVLKYESRQRWKIKTNLLFLITF